jgi:hypothetical protein
MKSRSEFLDRYRLAGDEVTLCELARKHNLNLAFCSFEQVEAKNDTVRMLTELTPLRPNEENKDESLSFEFEFGKESEDSTGWHCIEPAYADYLIDYLDYTGWSDITPFKKLVNEFAKALKEQFLVDNWEVAQKEPYVFKRMFENHIHGTWPEAKVDIEIENCMISSVNIGIFDHDFDVNADAQYVDAVAKVLRKGQDLNACVKVTAKFLTRLNLEGLDWEVLKVLDKRDIKVIASVHTGVQEYVSYVDVRGDKFYLLHDGSAESFVKAFRQAFGNVTA